MTHQRTEEVRENPTLSKIFIVLDLPWFAKGQKACELMLQTNILVGQKFDAATSS